MSEFGDEGSVSLGDLDDASIQDSYEDEVSISHAADDDEIAEEDEEDSSMLAFRLKSNQSDNIVSVEKTYNNYYNNGKILTPKMSKFERAKILGARAEMIASGDKPMVVVPKNITTAYEIALLELKANKIPLIIRRKLPNGTYEDWRTEELITH